MSEDEDLLVRIGTFFMLVGFVIFVMFVASDLASEHNADIRADFDYHFIAILAIGGGWLLRRRKPPSPSAGRFGMLNKMRSDAKKRKEDQQKAKAKK